MVMLVSSSLLLLLLLLLLLQRFGPLGFPFLFLHYWAAHRRFDRVLPSHLGGIGEGTRQF